MSKIIPILSAVRIVPRDSDFLNRKVGSFGEIFYDKDTNTLRLYDGNVAGGISLAKGDLSNIDNLAFKNKADAAGVVGAATISALPPESPVSGESWVDANTGNFYVYYNDGTSAQWIQPAASLYSTGGGGGLSTLNSLSDVVITSASIGQVLKYNGTTWINDTDTTAESGSASNSFANISVAGQSNVVADSSTDTLTLVAGPNITITTNAGNDSITISAAAEGEGGGGVSSGQANRLAYYASTGSVVQDTGTNLTWTGTSLNIGGSITASAEVSYVRAYFDTLAELQLVNPSTWHGMVAHVHEGVGRMYYAHGGTWQPIANQSDLVNNFTTVAVTGQASIVADQLSDIVTLTAGSGIAITTNANTDTITISAIGGGGTASDSFTTIAVAGQSNVVADSASDTLTLIAGANVTITTDAGNDSITISAAAAGEGGTASDSFSIIAVSGQSNVVADSSADTLTLVAGTGIAITTNASTDTVTITSTVSSGATAFTGLSDRADLTVDRFYLPAITMLNTTNNGASSYRFDQYGVADNPTVYAINGTTIAFNLNVVGHPFLIQTSGGSNYNVGLVHVTTGGTVTTGSSAQGKTSGTLYWKIPSSISGNYRYICSIHGGMVGVISIKDFNTI